MAEKSDVKFAHGLKANAAAAVAAGKIDKDDFIIFSDKDDELAFVNHDGNIKPIKARTNEAYTLNGTSIGALEDGATIPAGTSIDDLLKLIVAKAIHPTYTAPTLGLKSSITTYNQEVGTTISPKFTATYTKNDGGDLTEIKILQGSTEIETGTASPLEKTYEFIVAEGNNTFKANVSYAAGAIKKNNLQEDDAEGAIAAGSKDSSTITYTGKYNYLYGTTTTDSVTLDNLSKSLGAAAGTKFTISVPIGAKTIAFAYPSSLRDVSVVKYVETNDTGMAGNFSSSTESYTLPNGATKEYKLYKYTMDVAAAATMTMEVTI